ncbi:MAG: hypothetical protein ACJAYI_000550, partial [Myxococcota bacterium]
MKQRVQKLNLDGSTPVCNDVEFTWWFESMIPRSALLAGVLAVLTLLLGSAKGTAAENSVPSQGPGWVDAGRVGTPTEAADHWLVHGRTYAE